MAKWLFNDVEKENKNKKKTLKAFFLASRRKGKSKKLFAFNKN